MKDLLRVKWTRFHDGERFPVVLNARTGLPEFYPNTFIASNLRNNSCQSNTLMQAGRALMSLYVWAAIEEIDIVDRMLRCELLKPYEVDSLADAMWQGYDYLLLQLKRKKSTAVRKSKVVSLGDRRRSREGKEFKDSQNESSTTGVRLVYIKKYLAYLAGIGLGNIKSILESEAMRKEIDRMKESIKNRTPHIYCQAERGGYKRLGLTYEVQALLEEASAPDAPNNPWAPYVRQRNYLVVNLLLGFGLRRGELLNLRVEDFKPETNKLLVRRLPDNPEDPRLREPNVKTNPRELKLSEGLAELLYDYIVNFWGRIKGARRHDFLIVTHNTGAPLSLEGCGHIFKSFRKKVLGMPADLSPHIFRHTWNDLWSDYCDEHGVSEEKEQKIRNSTMGWKEGSKSALTYTRRHREKEANKYLLNFQEIVSQGRLKGTLDAIETLRN